MSQRGAVPVGYVSELGPVEARAVLYLRLWFSGAETQQQVWNDFASALGPHRGRSALHTLEELCQICAQHGRRPLMRHHVTCKCLGADEACFANFVAAAADGAREDAMLMATLIVRPDLALCIADLACDLGLALRQMAAVPRDSSIERPKTTTLH
ncbi:hypothetical protein [Aestuariivita sp.]|uniref:hypothetical protein n=1 Tax=Aestuariivita sp. TaxID=1872407 RepID=UPI0025BF1790|nr:hypothetical protein [Aestuariivita sp.]